MDLARFTFVIALAALVGCVGNEGDQCQEQDDCNDGLVCCPTNKAIVERGTCRPESECRVMGRDAGPPVDAGPPADAGTDAGPDVIRCDPGLVVAADGGGFTVEEREGFVARCPTGLYCNVPGCTGDGTCEDVPDACEGVLDPVCACASLYADDPDPRATFQNACEAAQASRSVESTGMCAAAVDAGPPDAGADAGMPDGGPDAG